MKPGGSKAGLRTVAVLEAVKGFLVLIVGIGLPGITQHKTHILLERIVKNFHLNPGHKVPHIFLELAHRLDNTHIWKLAIYAGAYSLIRFAEAYGLWRGRRWAEWAGCVGAAAYVPIEVAHLMKHHSWITYWILVINILIVIYLAGCLITGRKKKDVAAPTEGA